MKSSLKTKFKKISGWGKTNLASVEIINPKTIKEIENIIINSPPKSIIARGMGRSYGDAAQIQGGTILKLNNFKEIFANYNSNEITAQAGVSFEEILEVIIPKGYFLPVTPGTKKITLGGAIAADIHGKNHHQDGSFGNHVKRIRLTNGMGKTITLSPNNENKEFFWATIGGMGLTGIIIDATFSIIPIETSYIEEETTRCKNIEVLIKEMSEIDTKYKYSVAWIDSMHNDFRGILSCGNHAKISKYNNSKNIKDLSFKHKAKANIPDILPNNIMNKFVIKIFNQLWYLKSPKTRKKKKLKSINNFFYPLDAINNWNNIYGKKGFLQYQIVVPLEHSAMIKKILVKLKGINALSFLPVLKKLGKPNKSYLSFPISGWTLSIDLPANNKEVESLLNEIDKEVAHIGGRIYLAKDSRQSEYIFKKTYKLLNIWQEKKRILDPKKIFKSDIAIRLKII